MNQQVLVVGLGLIGASLALCIKNEHPDVYLYGWDHCDDTKEAALKDKIVDKIPETFAGAAEKADIILLAVPVKTAIKYLEAMAELKLKPSVIVTDTGSTKGEIEKNAARFDYTFIGGHPMAGSHKSGIQAVNPNLFQEAYYIFTKSISEVQILKELLKGTKAKYVEMSADEHDRVTGMLSHLPHIIAAGLVNQSEVFSLEHPRARQLAAGGFRDITRIASSDPQMWTDILLSNKEELLQLLETWSQQTERVKGWLLAEDSQKIYQFFDAAKDTRDRMPIHKSGAIPAFYDLFVDIPDVPGVIAEVTGLLGEQHLSITNIRILETREDILGVLQITFRTMDDLIKGKEYLEKETDYSCRLK